LTFYILACLSKTAVVFFPFLLLTHQFIITRLSFRKSLIPVVPFFLIALLTAIGRIFGHYASGQMEWTPFETFWSHMLSVFEIFGGYIKKLLLPFGLNSSYPLEPSTSLLDSGVLFGLFCLTGMIVLMIRYFREHPIICFGFAWYLAAWLPHSQIIPVPPALRADRYVYYSCTGFFLAAALGIEQLVMKAQSRLSSKWVPRAICVIAFFVAGLYAFMTVERNRVWSDSIALWSDSVTKDPQNPMAHCNLAMAYMEKGRWDDAIAEYKRALSINDRNADAHNNLAGLYVRKRRFDEAITEYKRALAIDGRLRKARTNLGAVYAMKGRLKDAISEFEAAVGINPNHAKTRYYLGVAYSKAGRPKAAISQFKRALAINPAFVGAYVRLAALLEKQGKLDDAASLYERAIRFKPNYYKAYINLARIYATARDEKTRNTKKAVATATKACQLTGYRSPEALDVLARSLQEAGDLKRAAEIRKRLMKLKGM
jgi:tetratricopeptide (TPR) repeat protein